MKIIYFLIAIFILSGCNSNKSNICPFYDAKEFKFFHNTFSLSLPKEFTLIDTANYDFEKNEKHLYNAEILSEDSLSSIFIMMEDFQGANVTSNDVQENIKRIRSVQISMIDANRNLVERYDTANEKVIGKFFVEGKRNGDDVSAGGITFYHKQKRVEILVMLSGSRFKNARETVECLLTSLKAK